MDIFEEIHKESMDWLLESFITGTSKGKRIWSELKYLPISFLQVENIDDIDEKGAVANQSFELTTVMNGIKYELELTEEINFPLEKGDITGSISFEYENEFINHNFGLSFDIDNYPDCKAADLATRYKDTLVVRLAAVVVNIFKNSEAVDIGFSYARFYNERIVKPEWKVNKTVRLCERLMENKKMEEFHKILLDMEYRKILIDRFVCI